MAEWRPTARVEATFRQVFPYGLLIDGFLLIGSNEPIALDHAAISARFNRFTVKKDGGLRRQATAKKSAPTRIGGWASN